MAPGGRELHANAIEAFKSQGPEGPLPWHHHKSIHAKIIHFHWTPSVREQGGVKVEKMETVARGEESGEGQMEEGEVRGGKMSVDIYGAAGG